jgi:hypothetical protein
VKRVRLVLVLALATASACGSAPDPALIPELRMPAEGALADNGCSTANDGDAIVWDFDWADVPGAVSYELWVKHRSSAEPEIHEMALGQSSHRVGRIATMDGSFLQGWEWKVRATTRAGVQPWSPAVTFNVEPPDTDCQ